MMRSAPGRLDLLTATTATTTMTLSPSTLLPCPAQTPIKNKHFNFGLSTALPPVLSNPRRRLHTAIVALIALCIVSLYFISAPLVTPSQLTKTASYREWRNRWRNGNLTDPTFANSWSLTSSRRKQLRLTPDQELAAITNFMASLASNAIPPSVDPSKTIDPDIVLGFDTRSPKAKGELEDLVIDVWEKNPIILFSELYSPTCREAKNILAEFNTKPSPLIFEVDQRADAPVLTEILQRLTGTTSFPLVLIGGKPVGPTISDLRALKESGELRTLIAQSTAIIDGAPKKKKGRK